MQQRRFQILSWLLISWQLLIPSAAPWLHTLTDGSVCADGRSVVKDSKLANSCEAVSQSHSGCSHSHRTCSHSHSGSESESEHAPNAPHDCSNCAVCQAIAAPRVLTTLLTLPVAVDRIEILSIAACSDPLLGFGLPPQCRAPPVVLFCQNKAKCACVASL